MPFPKLLAKLKRAFRPRKKSSNPPSQLQPARGLNAEPSSPSKSGQISPLANVVCPPEQRQKSAESTGSNPYPPVRSSSSMNHAPVASVLSFHPADTSSNSEGSRNNSSSRSPSTGLQRNPPHDASLMTNSCGMRGSDSGHTPLMKYRSWAEIEGQAQEEIQAAKVLENVAAKGMPGTLLNAKERSHISRRNTAARRLLSARIVEWGRGGGESLLWLSGEAGVGKSAIAQTAAEELKQDELLGAVYFFSRVYKRSDPDVVIPSLVYQLGLLLPGFRRIVTRKLVNDPLILNSDRRFQFENLIIDPFRVLASQQQQPSTQQPLVIILDGLDECSDRDAQCEFVEMISHHLRTETDLPLRWMVCSRPEPHLTAAFSSEDCQMICRKEELEVDESEEQKEARRILETGFAEIRQRYSDQLTPAWPGEGQVRSIVDRASGHLGLVSFIVRFVGDKDYHNPSGQLNRCLKFLERPGSTDPSHTLDLLYTRILSDIPPSVLSNTRRILGQFVVSDYRFPDAVFLANFLGLNQASFYRALQRLHSALVVPPPPQAARKPIRIYHASFTDYLKDRSRSGRFALDPAAVHLDVALRGLKWLSHHGRNPPDHHVLPQLMWTPPAVSPQTMVNSLCNFSFSSCWKACTRVPQSSHAQLIEALERFDFNLDYVRWEGETRDFAYFIRWLASLGQKNKNLMVIDHWTATIHPATKEEISVIHDDKNPHAFVSSFLVGARNSKTYSIHLRLGKSRPTAFRLLVSSRYAARFG